MARITVEDCSEQIPNMFQLVLVAAKRARQLANIAEGFITESILEEREHQSLDDLLDLEQTPMIHAPEDTLGRGPLSLDD